MRGEARNGVLAGAPSDTVESIQHSPRGSGIYVKAVVKAEVELETKILHRLRTKQTLHRANIFKKNPSPN